jgi:signal peptidase II
MGLCGGLLGCDHGTKLVAEKALGSGRVVTVVPHAMELRYARNSDVAFSALSQWDLPHKGAILLAVAALVTAVTIGFWIRHRLLHRGVWGLTDAGFAFVVAGALGNVIDRAIRGYVVDFIYVSHWPVFNVADVCVVLGLIALGLSRNREHVLSPRA